MSVKYSKVLYKYRLAERSCAYLDFAPPCDIITPYVKFYTTGLFVLEAGYLSDGCSGPTVDDDTNMQGGFIHDGGYQLMRLGLLDEEVYRPLFDKALRKICIIDGMSRIRADVYFEGVHLCGDQYAKPQQDTIYSAGKVIDLRKAKS